MTINTFRLVEVVSTIPLRMLRLQDCLLEGLEVLEWVVIMERQVLRRSLTKKAW